MGYFFGPAPGGNFSRSSPVPFFWAASSQSTQPASSLSSSNPASALLLFTAHASPAAAGCFDVRAHGAKGDDLRHDPRAGGGEAIVQKKAGEVASGPGPTAAP
jgi:hypothetical protein